MSGPRIEKKSVEGREEKGEKKDHLRMIYGTESLYYDETKLDEKNEQLITDQAIVVMSLLKLEFHKTEIYNKIEKTQGIQLTPEQKKLIYLRTFNLNDPIEKCFAEEKTKLEKETDEWDMIPSIYFSSYASKSQIAYSDKPEIEVERKKDRILVLKQGKEILEDILLYAKNPDANPLITANALKNLHKKIKNPVCTNGFVNELVGTLAELKNDPISLALRVLQNLATESINEIKAQSAQRNLDIYEGLETHANAELVNFFISHNENSKIPKIKDKYINIMTEQEKQVFINKCLEPGIITNGMIDIWVSQYLLLLQDAQMPLKKDKEEDDEEKEIAAEKRENFMKTLDILGRTHEDPKNFFDEKNDYRPKEGKEAIDALWNSIYKRTLKSGYIPEGILPRTIKKVDTDITCEVITTPVPYIQDSPEIFKQALDKTSATTHAYVLVDHNRKYDYWMLNKEPTLEDLKTLLPTDKSFAYGFLNKNQKYEMFFLQNNPALIRKIQLNAVNQRKIASQLKNLAPKDSPYLIERILKPTVKSIDIDEHATKKIFFVQKEPWTVFPILQTEDEYYEILKKLDILKLKATDIPELKDLKPEIEPFLDTATLKNKDAVAILSDECDHAPVDTLYVNHHSMQFSYIAPQRLSRDAEPILSLFDYFKMPKEKDSKSESENAKIIDALAEALIDPGIPENMLVRCFAHLTDNDLKYLIQRSRDAFFSDLLSIHDYKTADRFIQLSPEPLYPELKDPHFFGRHLIELLKSPDKIKEFFEFGEKHALIGDVNTDININHIVLAASDGNIDALNVLIELHPTRAFLEDNRNNSDDFVYCKALGLRKLILTNHFSEAGLWLKQFYSDEEFKVMIPDNDVTAAINTAIETNNLTKLKTILTSLPAQFIKLNELKSSSPLINAAIKGNLPMIDLLKKHGAIADDTIFFEYIKTGLNTLIHSKKYQEALQLLQAYPVEILKSTEALLFINLCDHAKNPSPDNVAQLKQLLDFLKVTNSTKIINHIDNFGNPALYYAAYFGNFKAIDLLIENKAATDLKPNHDGNDFNINLILCYGELCKNKNIDKMQELMTRYPHINVLKNNIVKKVGEPALLYVMHDYIQDEKYEEINTLLTSLQCRLQIPHPQHIIAEKLLKHAAAGTTGQPKLLALKKFLEDSIAKNDLDDFIKGILPKALALRNFDAFTFLISMIQPEKRLGTIQSLGNPLVEHFKNLAQNNDPKTLHELHTKYSFLFAINNQQNCNGLMYASKLLMAFPENQEHLTLFLIGRNLFPELFESIKEHKIDLNQFNKRSKEIIKRHFINIVKTQSNENLEHILNLIQKFDPPILTTDDKENAIPQALLSYANDSTLLKRIKILFDHKISVDFSKVGNKNTDNFNQWLQDTCEKTPIQSFPEFVKFYQEHSHILKYALDGKLPNMIAQRLMNENPLASAAKKQNLIAMLWHIQHGADLRYVPDISAFDIQTQCFMTIQSIKKLIEMNWPASELPVSVKIHLDKIKQFEQAEHKGMQNWEAALKLISSLPLENPSTFFSSNESGKLQSYLNILTVPSDENYQKMYSHILNKIEKLEPTPTNTPTLKK